MTLILRDRIALYYLVAATILAVLLFATVYGVVYRTVYNHLDEDLETEAQDVIGGLVILNSEIAFANPSEWFEREHGQIEVNPTFIQLVDPAGKVIRKTANLLGGALEFDSALKSKTFLSTSLSGAPTRQLQMPITNPLGKPLAYLIIAIPLEESAMVLQNLRAVILFAFPVGLLALFFISRSTAGRSIAPLDRVIDTAEKISRENLNERIALPPNKDELYRLATTLNELMARLQQAFEREKQFTSDASHELRTPLAVIRGTLEVLIRKPRDPEHYAQKIGYCIAEIDRMSNLVEQLLLLARYDSGALQPRLQSVHLVAHLTQVLDRMATFIKGKHLRVYLETASSDTAVADPAMLDVILENILSNAVKYSDEGKTLRIRVETRGAQTVCVIEDQGPGMTPDQVDRIFDRFYRTDVSRNAQTPGIGLGLAIVKRLADMQNMAISVKSQPDEGTSFALTCPA